MIGRDSSGAAFEWRMRSRTVLLALATFATVTLAVTCGLTIGSGEARCK